MQLGCAAFIQLLIEKLGDLQRFRLLLLSVQSHGVHIAYL